MMRKAIVLAFFAATTAVNGFAPQIPFCSRGDVSRALAAKEDSSAPADGKSDRPPTNFGWANHGAAVRGGKSPSVLHASFTQDAFRVSTELAPGWEGDDNAFIGEEKPYRQAAVTKKSVPKKPTKRKKGRAASVPGAMSFARARELEANLLQQDAERRNLASGGGGVKGELSATQQGLQQKRAAKSIPATKNGKRKTSKSDYSKRQYPELQQYYQTELLNAKEEYSLGMKVRLMVMCTDVHDGLASRLQRLPTIQEWANACGYVDHDPEFYAMEGDEQIRPAGSATMFDKPDPMTFVGTGLAKTAGPGRGHGRVKKKRYQVKKFYVDGDESPVNVGTPRDFVEMMMTAKEAKQRMVQCNMRLVMCIARKYANAGVSLYDLVQEGSLGLSRAAEKFDPVKGFKFSTYASWWIQQAIFRSIAYSSRDIRLPMHIHNVLNKIYKVRRQLTGDLGHPPTSEEMANEMGMTVERFNKILKLTKKSISVETPKYMQNPKDYGFEGDDSLADCATSDGITTDEMTPELHVDQGLFLDDIKTMLVKLEDDERRVIELRYGIFDGLTRTVTVVAAEMKRSKPWVRSQEYRALRKLRRPWYEKKLWEHQQALSI